MPSSSSNVIQQAEYFSLHLDEWSTEIESGRRLPAQLSNEFAQAGFFRSLVPQEYGGLELHPDQLMEMIKLVSMGDGSAGWNVMIGATTGLLGASLSDEYSKEIYANNPLALTVGVTAPLGRAVKVDEGYSVTGRWPFGSGSQNAQWICGGCFVFESSESNDPRINSHGAPELRLMMFNAKDVTIEDTWHVSGLRGTGSHHISVDDVYVPEGRSVVLGGRPRIQTPLYQFPMLGLLALGVASVSLGIGYRALKAFVELAGGKKPTGSNRNLGERALVQSEVARASAELQSAEAFMKSSVSAAFDVALKGQRLSIEHKANLRLAAVNATQKATKAVDRLYTCGGGSSIYESSVLQRCFRDIHVTTQHIMVADPVFEVVGRVALGLDPKSML